MITVHIDDSRARAKLEAVGKVLDPARINRAATLGVMSLVRSHLKRINRQKPNKLGGKRTNFYLQAEDSVHCIADSTEGIVIISHTGFAQRLYGGTITPVNRRFLTIPIAPEAYNSRVSDFPGAFICRIKGKAYIATKSGKGKDDTLRLLFALVKSVTQAADRSVLPDDDAIATRAATSVRGLIQRVAAEPSTLNQIDPSDSSEE